MSLFLHLRSDSFKCNSILLIKGVLNEISQKEILRKVNKDLSESRERYIELSNEQRDIIDVMGHEIRTPLTIIIQSLNLHKKFTLHLEKKMLKKIKNNDDLYNKVLLFFETIKTIDRVSTHAAALVSDMLETARLDKKSFELNYEEFDIIKLVRDGIDLIKKSVETFTWKSKLQISFSSAKHNKLSVLADKTRISQALYSILNNAIKYRDPEKKFTNISVELTVQGNFICIKISDNGIGINQKDISKLGRKFVRLKPKTAGNLNRPGGTGLGLFVAKGIMEMHKGKLVIESEGEQKGSTFSLVFPKTKTT